MARTILAEELHIRPEVIEHQLAHRVPDALGTAYNRTEVPEGAEGHDAAMGGLPGQTEEWCRSRFLAHRLSRVNTETEGRIRISAYIWSNLYKTCTNDVPETANGKIEGRIGFFAAI